MAVDMTPYWMFLEMVFGPGNVKIHQLLEGYDNVQQLYYGLHDPDCGLLTDEERRMLRHTSMTRVQSVMEYCEKNGIGIMTIEDEIYPDNLRHIYNPPGVLFYQGDVSLLNGMILTVVGARNASAYTLRATGRLCAEVCRCNVIVASGCAIGIDAAAHWAAINSGEPTIGVMGCSLEYDYPVANREMKERIRMNGLLLSEYFPGTGPKAGNFPVRNRILAGISEAVMVAEASARSGSLITANLACEMGKQVICIPPTDIFDRRYEGVCQLLRDGAYPVFDVSDLLYLIYLKYPFSLSLFDQSVKTQKEALVFEKEEKPAPVEQRVRVRAVPAAVQEEPQGDFPQGATEQQRRILALLRKGKQNTNALCIMLDIDFAEISEQLVEMEMHGWIRNSERDLYEAVE